MKKVYFSVHIGIIVFLSGIFLTLHTSRAAANTWTLNKYTYTTSDSSFISTWKTNNPGTSDSTSISIPTYPENNDYNFDIDWDNDGIYDEFGIDSTVTHDFGTSGEYTIRIRGNFPRIYFNDEGDKEKLIDIVQWGAIEWKSMAKAFKGCSNMNISSTDAPDLAKVESFVSTFFGCTNFNSNINHWDVSSITNFYFAFGNCINFNQPLNNWDVSAAENMQRMFIGCSVFNQPLDQWDVSQVRSFSAMFSSCKAFNQPIGNWDVSSGIHFGLMFLDASSFNQPIGNWNTSNMTALKAMFHKATVFNQDISNWDVSKVTNFSSVFKNALDFNQNINNWDVSNATDMSWMFAGAASFNQPLDQWNVSKVLTMSYLFFNTNNFNQDIGGWDVSSVTNMQNMFKGPNMVFNQDIGNWDVSLVTNMNAMFEHNISFDQNLGNWNVSKVTSMERMFHDCKLSTINYDSLLIRWNQLELQDSIDFHGGFSIYCLGGEARANMMNNRAWSISDAGAEKDIPFALCKDTTLFLDPSGVLIIDPVILDNGSFDACSTVSFLASKTSFTCDDLGVLNDTLTVTDINGNQNTCVSTITIQDTPFTLNCPPDITVEANTSNCQAMVNWIVPQSFCTINMNASHESGDLFQLGTTQVDYIAIDSYQDTFQCSFMVTVENNLTVAVDTLIHPGCQDSDDGQAFVLVTGGEAPYLFDWSTDGSGDFDDAENPINLPIGTSYLTIQDNNGCITSDSIDLSPTSLNIINCPTDQTVTANSFGCTAVVSWNEPMEICSGVPLFSDYLSGDTFDLGTTIVNYTATNTLGETATCSFNVTVENNMEILLEDASPPNCFESSDGHINITLIGGQQPYNIDWNIDGNGDFDDPEDLSDLPQGVYTIEALDALGCNTTTEFELFQPDPINITVDSVLHPSCSGAQNGAIFITPGGGTGYYEIDWNNDGQGDFDDNENLFNLSSGMYILEVIDNDICSKLDTIILHAPDSLIASAEIDTPSISNELTIDLDILGGSPPYLVNWNTGQQGYFETFPGITVSETGNYSVVITDDNNCNTTLNFPIVIPDSGCDVKQFNIHPNPSFGAFTIDLDACEEVARIEIFDLLGRKIYSEDVTSNSHDINIDHLSGETYYLSIHMKGEDAITIPIALIKK